AQEKGKQQEEQNEEGERSSHDEDPLQQESHKDKEKGRLVEVEIPKGNQPEGPQGKDIDEEESEESDNASVMSVDSEGIYELSKDKLVKLIDKYRSNSRLAEEAIGLQNEEHAKELKQKEAELAAKTQEEREQEREQPLKSLTDMLEKLTQRVDTLAQGHTTKRPASRPASPTQASNKRHQQSQGSSESTATSTSTAATVQSTDTQGTSASLLGQPPPPPTSQKTVTETAHQAQQPTTYTRWTTRGSDPSTKLTAPTVTHILCGASRYNRNCKQTTPSSLLPNHKYAMQCSS
ncbi:hypothetical protein KEM55_004143, partial [Ascosphaera atra]